MYNKALFICRFQPFHLGHLKSLEFALAEAKHVVVGIGSSQEHSTDSNPLTAEERMHIIDRVLRSKRIRRYSILEIPDFGTDREWYEYIMNFEEGIDIVITSNPGVRKVFKAHGIRVMMPPMERRNEISGTIIRRKIRNSNDSWRELVHPVAAKIIQEKLGRIKGG